MKNYLTIKTHKNGYRVEQCGHTLTIAELIDYLSQWDDNTSVYLSNDNGYTYGSISFEDINSEEVNDDDK